MNANVFMFFDCFLEEDQEVEGAGRGQNNEFGGGRGSGYGNGLGSGFGEGSGIGEGKGYGWGRGAGFSSGQESRSQPILCLTEIRSSTNER